MNTRVEIPAVEIPRIELMRVSRRIRRSVGGVSCKFRVANLSWIEITRSLGRAVRQDACD
jgi:hypothetical protein